MAGSVLQRELARRNTGPVPVQTRPWSTKDLTRLLAVVAFAGVALGICWLGVSGTVVWRDQIIWTATAIGAVAIAGLTIMSWLLTGFRNVRIRQSDFVDSVAARLVLPDLALPSDPIAAVALGELVTVAGMTRAHRPGCLLLRGKTPIAVTGPMDVCEICR